MLSVEMQFQRSDDRFMEYAIGFFYISRRLMTYGIRREQRFPVICIIVCF